MRVISWNVKGAGAPRTRTWDYLRAHEPDIALLQEVGAIPSDMLSEYECCVVPARRKNGGTQNFKTGILVKGTVGDAIALKSDWDWVDRELECFSGNLVAHHVTIRDGRSFRVMSAHSPAWPIPPDHLVGIDVTAVKLKNNPRVWVTELLWASMRSRHRFDDQPWIVGGDLNASPTFDDLWGSKPRGNREFLERMASLGFTECLAAFNGKLVPTFAQRFTKEPIHQMDHLFAEEALSGCLKSCTVGDYSKVLGDRLSDHVPIIADFS